MDTILSFLESAISSIQRAKNSLSQSIDRTNQPGSEIPSITFGIGNDSFTSLETGANKLHTFNNDSVDPILLQTPIEVIPLNDEIARQEEILDDLLIGTPEYKEQLQLLADLKNNNTNFNEIPFGSGMGQYFNDNITEDRQKDLNGWSQELVNEYLHEGELSHTNMGQILDDLSDLDTLSDVEKAYMWTTIANNKEDGAWIFGIGGAEGDYKINNDGINPDVIDSAYFNGDATQGHTVVGFDDGYHGRMGNTSGDNGAAESEIIDHESGKGLPSWMGIPRLSPNEGDANASLATVDAFRGFREGGFNEFADRWKDNMLAPPEEVVEVPTGTTTTTTTVPDVPSGTSTTTTPNPPTGTTTTVPESPVGTTTTTTTTS